MAEALRAVIAEDEPLARKRLRQALAGIGGVTVVGSAGDGKSAVELINRIVPDIVFLDIRMPGLSGIELLRAIDLRQPPEVVFVSAYDAFAIDAFEQGAIDYVLKPVDDERLARAVERARERIRTRDAERRLLELNDAVEKLSRRKDAAEAFERDFWISEGERVVRVPVREVIWIEAAGDYVVVHGEAGNHVMYDSLSALETRLDPDEFVRVHRSAIVRKPAVEAIERSKFGAVRLNLRGGFTTNVGRTYRKNALQSLRPAPAS